MKNAKKIFAALIAFVLTMSMAIPAFAAGTNKITVTNTVEKETYSIYKMADLATDGNGEAYSYTVTDDWKAFFNQENVKAYFTVNDKGTLTTKKSLTAEEMRIFSKLASQYAEENGITALETKTSPSDGAEIAFENLDNGYYMISSTLGTRAIIESTPKNTEQKIDEKNEKPTLDKEVEEDSTGDFGSANDAEVGQTVNFKVTISAKSGAKNYVMHDKMEKGLKFDPESVVIKSGNTTLVAGTHYNVVTDTEDDCTFEIVFTQSYLNTITKASATKLEVTYSAVLTEDAVVVTGVKNEAKLTYGDKQETEWDKTTTTTHALELIKYKEGDATKKVLAGATFQLKNADGEVLNLVPTDKDGNIVKTDENGYIVITDEEGNPVTTEDKVNYYRLATADDDPADIVDSFTTNDLGTIKIKGLDSDKYSLAETQAPAGYNILNQDKEVTIHHEENADHTQVIQMLEQAEVANGTGTELPSTGGMGTTILFIAGGALVLAAVVVFITKRRMGAEEA